MEHKKIVVAWKEFKLPRLLPRLYEINLNADFITTISGPRRAGKTYLCFQLIQGLLKKKISMENILYVNFEDNRLLGATADDLDRLFDSYIELSEINKSQQIYFFFDEIQTVSNWDSWIRKSYDTRKDVKLVLTGSSSKLLSKEISSMLRGRVINREVMPLSFRELLLWDKISYNLKTISFSKDKAEVKKSFNKFLKTGGFPAVIANKNVPPETILQGYYDSMILKDIVERHKIEDVNKMKHIARLLFQSVCSEISYNSLANKLKSIGFKISKSTVIEYIAHFQDAYLFFQNLKYEYSMAKQLGSIKKVYCIDNGLLNAMSFKFSEDFGKLMENMVFIELKRRGDTVYYHRKSFDCDFLILKKNKIVNAIQVTKKLGAGNERRELRGLMEALEEHNLKQGLILTEDEEEERSIEGKKIIILPVWKWLLE